MLARGSQSILCLLLLLGLAGAADRVSAAEAVNKAAAEAVTVDFTRDIRPLLSNSCFACHGPDEADRQADLRLDVRDVAVDEMGVIVPGDAEGSSLLERIMSTDPDEQMPPAGSSQAALSQDQIEMVRRWIDAGAEYAEHWAYEKPTRPEVPEVAGTTGAAAADPVSEIDAFVAQRLAGEGLEFSPAADRRTLIRRLSFDLLGLPPSPEEVREFVADARPDAYERLVDRLLASPHFGERMAIAWLDLVRYADTNGIHGDNVRPHSPYRDYVIAAFNDNKPFDRFTIEQLAGDLLSEATIEEKIASGYNRLNMTTQEGGAQPKEYRAKYAADRVRNVSSVWLGSTLACAECHDHKYDPFTTKDFYTLAAYFADIKETAVGKQEPVRLPTPEQRVEIDRLNQRVAEARKVLMTQTPELDAAQDEWEAKLAARRADWRILRPTHVASAEGATLTVQKDGSVLASGTSPDVDLYTVEFETDLAGITAFRFEMLADESLPNKGPGRSYSGSLVINEMEMVVVQHDPRDRQERHEQQTAADRAVTGAADRAVTGAADGAADGEVELPLQLHNPSATYEAGGYTAAHAIDGKVEAVDRGWAIAPQLSISHEGVFHTQGPIGVDLAAGEKLKLRVRIHQNHGTERTLGRFRFAATTSDPTDKAVHAGGVEKLAKNLADALATPRAERDEAAAKIVSTYFRENTPVLDEARAFVEKCEAERDQFLRPIPLLLVSEAVEPRMMRVLPRGNWLDDSGEVVSPATPEFLFSLASHEAASATDPHEVSGAEATTEPGSDNDSDAESEAAPPRATRLDLARWLVHGDNPLVSRVMVNRLWKIAFGTGLVKTGEDFGSQGALPTHPELLDYLAVEYRESGWDTKALLKRIVMSRTYRQASLADAEARRRDPFNELLARQSRFRLEAEMVRDNALAVSGLLVRKIGGRSVRPYQPAGYYEHLNFPKRRYDADQGESQYRRGVYTHWQRTFLHPALKAFDAPTREECTANRPRSNTPLAALVLLNDPTHVEAARALATRMLQQGGSTAEDRIAFAFRQVLQREPSEREREVVARVTQRHLDKYRGDEAAARQLVSIGDTPVAEDLDPVELAAYTSAARIIMNLHETITRN